MAVNVWYHVGSKNEPAARPASCAPVRAPDVFNGSEHQGNDDWFKALEKVGATST
ncbi:hypothetical protein ACRAWD_21855 [Caulobacter segnis]